MSQEKLIFKKGSTTYYFSSVFFPKKQREDVFKLYSFVRVVDDFIDSQTPNIEDFKATKKLWQDAKRDAGGAKTYSNLRALIVSNILYLSEFYKFDPSWIKAFFKSMQMDLDKRRYKTIDDTLKYIHGSAEVVGLMMSKIMGLDEAAFEAAKLQGRAMQFINFIRDIDEDNALGRCYFPQKELRRFGLNDLSEATARQKPEKFAEFMRYQIERYQGWQREADAGMKYIPHRLRIPIRTAARMYGWTAEQIAQDPMVVFSRKVKPTKWRVLRAGITQIAGV